MVEEQAERLARERIIEEDDHVAWRQHELLGGGADELDLPAPARAAVAGEIGLGDGVQTGIQLDPDHASERVREGEQDGPALAGPDIDERPGVERLRYLADGSSLLVPSFYRLCPSAWEVGGMAERPGSLPE